MKKPINRYCALHGKTEWPFSKIAGGWICSVCIKNGMYNYNVVKYIMDREGLEYGRRRENTETR